MRKPSSVPSVPPLRPLLAIPLALALGCADPDFNRPELLELPRILAMQAEPPQPSHGTATTLRALIYQPDDRPRADECVGVAEPGPKYEWTWCPLPTSSSNGFRCPLEQAQLALLFAAFALGPAPSLDLGTGETATLANPFPASLLYRLCLPPLDPTLAALLGLPPTAVSADATESPLGCDMPPLSDPDPAHPLGYPVTVMLKYTPPCGSPHQEKYGDTLTSVFTVHLPTDDTLPPNQNPVVGDIFAISEYAGTVAPKDAAPLPSGDAPVPLDAGVADGGAGGAVDAGETIDGGEAFDGATTAADASSPTTDVALAAQPPDSGMPPVPVNLALLPRQKRVGLWLDMPDSNAEFLVRTGKIDVVQAEDKKNNIPAKVLHFERLSLLWFAEAGDFGGAHGNLGRATGFESTPDRSTFTEADEDAMERARQVVWALPYKEDYGPDQARIVVVIRDSRGGVAWTSAVANLEETR